MTKMISLTRGFTTIVDDEMYDILSLRKWCAAVSERKGTAYAIHAGLKDQLTGKRTHVMMHRVICGAPRDMVVDHINHNTLDNRRENLRICSVSENNRNLRPRRNQACKFKGVWLLPNGKWRARLTFNSVGVHIGCFDTMTEAANAYDAKSVELFGEFAMTNRKLGLFENEDR